jgi:cystathionine beta-lyase
MTTYNFDEIIPRRGTHSAKHDSFDADVTPMFVAETDFKIAPAIQVALRERVEHGFFGYPTEFHELSDVICQRMKNLYNWAVQPEEIVYMPGVIPGFGVAIQMAGSAGDNVLMCTPLYPPFSMSTEARGRAVNGVEMIRTVDAENKIHYTIDFDAFEAAIDDHTAIFTLCNPHNPIGRVWTREELTRLAEICLRHDVLICSDEIHSDLTMPGYQHIPIASLSPEIAQRTITLSAPTKAFNLPGLACSFAIIQNEALRQQFNQTRALIVPHVGVATSIAALAAYRDSLDWLEELRLYLDGNRQYIETFLREELPEICYTPVEATFLQWMDVSSFVTKPSGNEWIEPFFLREARVALNTGYVFGKGGEGFVRMNFGCPRATLEIGLQRIKETIERARAVS